jgi:hypothetical protein
MAALDKIAYFQHRRDEIPNQLLAKELAHTRDIEGIREIAENLWNKNMNVRSDCLKVLYEIGYLDPSLITPYGKDFLELLDSLNNRMVWGAMIGLAAIAEEHADALWVQIVRIIRIDETGTLITLVWGLRVLASVAASKEGYKDTILPFLLKQILTCIPRDVPTHAESILCVVDQKNKTSLLSILDQRRSELTPAQLTRLNRVVK